MPRLAVRNSGTALLFNGGTNVVTIATPPALNTTLSVAFWVKALPTSPTVRVMGTYQSLNWNIEYSSTGQFNFNFFGAGGHTMNGVIADGNWHHFAVTFQQSASSIVIYKDGLFDSNFSDATVLSSMSSNTLELGTNTGNPFFGSLDDIYFYNGYILTATDVANIYFRGNYPSGASAAYNCNEGVGTVLTDISGNGKTGTLSGATFTANVPMKARQLARDFGTALRVLNSTDQISISSVPTSPTMTYAFWTKLAGPGSSGMPRFFDNSGSGNAAFAVGIALATGDFSFASWTDTGYKPLYGVWYHVVTVFNNTTTVLYINGIQVFSGANTANTVASGTLLIGSKSGEAINGTIDEFRQWNSILTAQQISDLYFNNLVPTGAIIELLMNEGAGSLGTSGTITGSTYTADTVMKPRKNVGGNLIPNGNFEFAPPFTAATAVNNRYIDGTAAGSTTNKVFGPWGTNSGGTYAIQFDSSTSHSGLYSLKLSTTAINTYSLACNGIATAASALADGASVLPSTSYTLAWWMKTNYVSGSAGGTNIAILECDGGGNTVTTTRSATQLVTTTAWTAYSLTVITSANTRFIQIEIGVQGNNGAGTLIMDSWFDDIVLLPTLNTIRTQPLMIKASVSGGATNQTSNSGLLDISAGGTVALWIKFIGAPSGNNIWQFKDASSNDAWRLNIESASNKLFTWHVNSSNAGSVGFKTNTGVALQQWIRVVCTNDGAGGSGIYVNGQFLGSGTGNVSRSTANFSIFPANNNGMYMSKLSVWQRVLTGAEVLNDYAGSTVNTPALVWNLDEGAGTVLYDSSGNSLNSTGNSTTYTVESPSKSRQNPNNLLDNQTYNGFLRYIPPVNVATTPTSRWIDGTAGGNTSGAYVQPFGWRLNGGGTIAAMFDTANLTPNGFPSVKLSTLAIASQCSIGNASSTLDVIQRGGLPVQPSTTYNFSGYMKTNYVSGVSNNGASLAVLPTGGNGNARTTFTFSYVQTTTAWTLYSFSFTTAATDRFVYFDHRVYGHTGTATLIMDAWFGEMSLSLATT
jgi:hypothetical protein